MADLTRLRELVSDYEDALNHERLHEAEEIGAEVIAAAREVAAQAAAPAAAGVPPFTAEQHEWIEYAIDHMEDDSEPEDKRCAEVLRDMLSAAPPSPVAAAAGVPDSLRKRAHNMRRDFSTSTMERARFWANECRGIVEAMLSAAPPSPVAAASASAEVCDWSQQELGFDGMNTSCGHEFYLNEASGYPDGRRIFPHCPYCAKPAVFNRWKDLELYEAAFGDAAKPGEVGRG